MLQLVKSTRPFDALVVGSGATGGWAAKQLTQSGMQVALLEAGERTTATDFSDHDRRRERPFFGPSSEICFQRPIQSSCYACREPKCHWFVNDLENPYHQVKPYRWIRMRALGGRLLAWEGESYRMSNLDFKAASYDGYGDDWPISYEDLIPYYEKVERYIGVTGRRENLPHLPDSIFQSDAVANPMGTVLRDSVRTEFGRLVTPARLAVMTRSSDSSQACYYCGPSKEGRLVPSYFSSPWIALTDAAKTGRLALITNAVVSHILLNNGKATGVAYVDRVTRIWGEVRAKIVVLCASTLESTRILLNSDICNSSEVLGRYLMDHIFGGGAVGTVEDVPEPLADSDQCHRFYIPRFRNVKEKTTHGFIRGYGFQGRSTLEASLEKVEKESTRAVGAARWTVGLQCFGECLARKENFVEIDRNRFDTWGIPILRIQADWSQNELRLLRDASAQGAEMLEASSVRHITVTRQARVPGLCIHETGTARMGNNPKTSVVNKYCQVHEVPNIFVTDGACWVSSGCQNPTLTMMAITVRACDYIVREYSKQLR
jgi:choline dehydrogenase-like flavoprotein